MSNPIHVDEPVYKGREQVADLHFNYKHVLGSGESLTGTPTVSKTIVSGTETNTSSITNVQINGDKVEFRFSGGGNTDEEVKYCLVSKCDFDTGEEKVPISGHLVIPTDCST